MNRESILYLLTLSLLFFTQKWNIPETKFMTYYLVGVIINFMCQLDWAISSVVIQLCLTLCDPMDCSTPGFPVHHQLPELAQTCVHQVGDAVQLSHPLSSPSPPTFSLSQHQGLFQ